MNRMIVSLAALLVSISAVAEEIGATLEWSKRVELGVTLSGVIETVAVKPGQRVKKGDLLVALDDSYFKARVAKAEAELGEAKQNQEEGVRELERATELYDRTVLSDHDLHMAQIGEARAKALWHKAQAELAEARIRLQQSRIQAPFAGVITGVFAQTGQAVVSGLAAQPLVEMADDSQLIARAEITPEQINNIGDQTDFSVDIAGNRFPAKLLQIGLQPLRGATSGAPLYDLQVSFDRPESLAARVGLPAVISTTQ
ncbi:MAG: hypothetical protein C0631_11705 [Sedimenticola sp.]|nr:MAG: hypothetical protein C0631_11705 [Sedimenticola sp.]